MALRRTIVFAVLVFQGACGPDLIYLSPDAADLGNVPDAGAPPIDPNVTPPPVERPAPVPPNQNVRVSGLVRRLEAYLRGENVALPGATIRALGATGVTPVVSDAQGTYAIEVPQNGKIVFEVEKTLHFTTYETVTVGDTYITGKNFLLASDPYAVQVASAYGVDLVPSFACHAPNPTTASCRFATVIGRLVDDGTEDNGTPTPVAGVEKAGFSIKSDGSDAWYKKGPYFLAADGTPSAAITASQRERDPATQKYRGGLYVVFLEVPEVGPQDRDFEIRASSNDGTTIRYFGPITVKAVRDGLAWATIPQTARDTPPPPPPPIVQDVDFDTEIYPLFLTIPQGGLGCQGCHTNQGGAIPAGGMNLYGGPEVAFQALDPARYPERVNVANPPASLLVVKPLYEADGVQDHPIYAFVGQDRVYQLLVGWIREGATRNIVVDTPVSFYNQVRPILYQPTTNGGAGCYACHVDGVNRNNAPGELYFGGDGNQLYQELTAERPTDNGNTGEPYRINKAGQVGSSLLLINPLLGSLEPHPVKLFSGVDDTRYQIIYRWISQGYVNDTP